MRQNRIIARRLPDAEQQRGGLQINNLSLALFLLGIELDFRIAFEAGNMRVGGLILNDTETFRAPGKFHFCRI
ncbi:hypothetical protein ACFL4X_01705 [Gemmatimonadota bacterium]